MVQDCFELAWRNIDQLRDRKLAKAWLFQILRRAALRNLAPPNEAYQEELDQRRGSDAVAALEQRMDILGAMQILPAIHREVLTLFYFEDMAVAEMAVALEVAPGTVLSRLNRAREALREAMNASLPDNALAARDAAEPADVLALRRSGASGRDK